MNKLVFVSRRALAVTSFLCIFAASYAQAAADAASRPSRPPNILLIMTDQQTHSAMRCAGNTTIRTPNLDRLASEGARITGAVCATPFCTPTRASLRTGLWPHTHGFTYNVAPDQRTRDTRRKAGNRKNGLDDEPDILDNILARNGYRLEHLGKWHLGDVSDLTAYREKKNEPAERAAYQQWLQNQGDSVRSNVARPGEKYTDSQGGVFVRDAAAKLGKELGDEDEADGKGKENHVVGRSAIAPKAQLVTWYADRAMEFMAKHADRPFMVTYSVSPPHAPWIAPDPYYSLYDPDKMILPVSFNDRPAVHKNSQAAKMGAAMGEAGLREYLRCYYAQVTMVDEQVGRILDKVRELGLERNTLVIFTSDHGDLQAAHGFMGKSVHVAYEEVVRVPLLVRYPPTIQAGTVLDLAANSVDLMPTILDYAGVAVPSRVQGRSLRPFLDGKSPCDDAPAFCERGLDGKAVMRMVRSGGWKYTAYGDGRRELFDLAKDPGEMRNLAIDAGAREHRVKLDKQLRDWMKQTDDPAMKDLFPKGQ